MTSNEADKPIIAYKGFDKNLKCRDFQYEVGKTYTHDGEVEACEGGFHACENPLDVLNYYGLFESRYAVVEQSGKISRHKEDSKIASAVITIKAELSLPEFIKRAVDWAMKNAPKAPASGNDSQLAASGYDSQLAASGNNSKLAALGYDSKLAASGYNSQLAASGNNSKLAASGYNSKLAASGYNSQLAASGNNSKLAAWGDDSIVSASGYGCVAKAGENGAISLAWHDGKRPRISVAYVGENGIKADTWYRLNDAGEFVEAV